MILEFDLHEVLNLIDHAISSENHERTGVEKGLDSSAVPGLWLVCGLVGDIYMKSNGFPNDVGIITPIKIKENTLKEERTTQFIEVLPIENMVKGLQGIENYSKFIIEISRDKIDVGLEI